MHTARRTPHAGMRTRARTRTGAYLLRAEVIHMYLHADEYVCKTIPQIVWIYCVGANSLRAEVVHMYLHIDEHVCRTIPQIVWIYCVGANFLRAEVQL